MIEDDMKIIIRVDIVIVQRFPVIELSAIVYQCILFWWDADLVLDLLLNGSDAVGSSNIQKGMILMIAEKPRHRYFHVVLVCVATASKSPVFH